VPEQFTWGYAGATVAAADVRGDGRDQIVNLFPVCFWLADGRTGEIVTAQELAARKVLPAWAAYGEPVVYDFDGDGHQEVLLDSPYLLAVLDRQGQPLWHGKPKADYPTGTAADNDAETTSTRHAIVDFNGDGTMEIASAGYRDGVRAIDPRDGRVLWSLMAPAPTAGKCAAADINGDGGDELLYVAGSELLAVTGDLSAGRILWRWQGPASLSLPAIADVDGDTKAEIVVQSADGVVHCLDGGDLPAGLTK
jgi:outer membrane protein assembly factor BamB